MSSSDPFSEESLTPPELQELLDAVTMTGDVGASVVALGRMARSLAEMSPGQIADLSLALGDCGDVIEPAITNIVCWYMDTHHDDWLKSIVNAKLAPHEYQALVERRTNPTPQ